jgi:DNA mismatch endonuclease (patch repair protein)
MRFGRERVPVDTLTPKQRSAAMAAVTGKNTGPELVVRKLLYGLGYRYRLHVKDLPGRPDIVFRKRRCVVFVNGCFWHGHDCPRGSAPSSNVEFWERKIGKNRERDSRVQHELRKDGWRMLTVWQCETKDRARLLRRLSRFLEKSKWG